MTYTPWEPVSLQIHCREVSPVVYLGRLFVFWTQITTAPINIVNNANSIFDGYKHTWRVKYSSLRLDQTWTPPQQLAMTDATVFPQGRRRRAGSSTGSIRQGFLSALYDVQQHLQGLTGRADSATTEDNSWRLSTTVRIRRRRLSEESQIQLSHDSKINSRHSTQSLVNLSDNI